MMSDWAGNWHVGHARGQRAFQRLLNVVQKSSCRILMQFKRYKVLYEERANWSLHECCQRLTEAWPTD